MATILLSTVGAAVGGTFGGTVLGLTGAVIGKAIGASVGGLIDQKIMGSGSRIVETGRIESFRFQGASEGAAVPRVMGRARIAGQLIWSSQFEEKVVTSTSGGGKGAPQPSVTTQSYSYCVSCALAVGEGVVDKIGRIWADGTEISKDGLNIAFYGGDENQTADPTIAAVEGIAHAPSYRGTAYVVFEGLDLTPYGNRIPQFNFEVFRKAQPEHSTIDDPSQEIRGVNLIPGTGEYALATTKVQYPGEFADGTFANVNTSRGETDLLHGLDDLETDIPNVGSVSLVVSWFGDDLRCGSCTLTPRVEQAEIDGDPMPWSVAGITRATAQLVSRLDDRPVFGGTPADAAVLESIAELKSRGQSVVFYPFILMDIQSGNGLPDPYSDEPNQPVMPWRGRITLSDAPGRAGSPDGTPAAGAEVSAFFGSAQVSDFAIVDGAVVYSGPAEWSYRRFILHYAHLCALAGGIEAFNIGSEMRGLTQIRDGAVTFAAVAAFQQLVQDVRSVVGAGVKLGYAADWSEYFGYHPQDGSGNVFFHLDPLWAQAEMDYIGIDNYMPIADWRDTLGHLDEGEGSIYSLSYLAKNIAGGEGFDWFYRNEVERDAQNRELITDGAYSEPWVFRYKDLISWWGLEHYNRIGGIRQSVPTQWLPQSKPIRFTELGCPAVDKGANQPNVFFDEKSSESALPYYSNGSVDAFMQAQYLRATYKHWRNEANNPQSEIYFAPMVDLDNSHVWAWDARPWPEFPNRLNVWSDGVNYARGHWITGRFGQQSLATIVSEVCEISNLTEIDVSELYGATIGFAMRSLETGRQSLQPLMLAFDFSAAQVDGKLVFKNKSQRIEYTALEPDLARLGADPVVAKTRLPEAETVGRVRVSFWDDSRDYQTGTSEYILADDASRATSHVELPITLNPGEGANIAARWLSEARIARDEAKFSLPSSVQHVVAGDVVRLGDAETDAIYRVERLEEQGARIIEAVRVEQTVFKQKDVSDIVSLRSGTVATPAKPVFLRFLDLPLLRSDQSSNAPFVAATVSPWPGGVVVYQSASDDGYAVNRLIEQPSQIGITETPLEIGCIGRWMEGASIKLRISDGSLQSRSRTEVLNGANAFAIGSGSAQGWEIIQFREAILQPDGSFELRGLLRGQLGSDADMVDWPSGSEVVFLDTLPNQLAFQDADRGLERFFRYGPAGKPISDSSYKTTQETFDLIALRPYAPAHLRVQINAGDLEFDWLRRTRINGDNWNSVEVPLGETMESYVITVANGGLPIRTVTVGSPNWTYTTAMQASDAVSGVIEVSVAQISELFGAGGAAQISTTV